MSAGCHASTESTFDEDAEFIRNSSAAAADSCARELPSRGMAKTATQQQQQRHSKTRIQCALTDEAMLTDTMTMGHAVRVPHALRSATRRTMLDVFSHPKPIGNEATCGCPNEPATTDLSLRPTDTGQQDLRRSLRHLLPSRCDVPGGVEMLQETGEEDHSISEFEDEDEDDDDDENNNRWEGNADEVRRTHWPQAAETRQHTARQVTWAKLFDCEDPHEEGPMPSGNRLTAVQRTPTCTGELRETTGCRPSLATLLDAAEVRNDMEHARNSSSSATGGSRRGEGRRSFMDALAVDGEEKTLPVQQHSIGKPPALVALHSVVQRGRGRGGLSMTLKQLSENPTSACVVAYLTRSLNDWKLDGAAVTRANDEGIAHGSPSAAAAAATATATLLTASGVHLKFRVRMVENAFSLCCLRGVIVWSDAQTQAELHSADGAAPALATEQEQEQQQQHAAVQNTLLTTAPWTVVLTAAVFRSTPVVVGEHLYIAQPFFLFPTIHTIVASFNVTSDAVLQRLRSDPYNTGTRQHSIRHRRPREAEVSDQQCYPVSVGESHAARRREATVDAMTPERTCRSQAPLSGASPFRAYDPFVNPPENLFRKNSATAFSSSCSATAVGACATPSQVRMERQQLGSASIDAAVDAHAAAGDQTSATYDTIGAGFPRGPGDEWDVPLEVLLALLPPRSPSPSGVPEIEARKHCRDMSSLSSLSSLD